MNLYDLAWAAGFFDGEGTIGAYRGRSPSIGMSMGQVDRRPLDRFQQALGGLGRIDGPWEVSSSARPNSRPQYRWRLTAWADVQAVVAMLWPFLSPPKREQAHRALLRFHTTPRKISQPRLVNGRAEVCGRGHSMDEHAYVRPNGVRQCRECIRAGARERWKDPEFRARRIESHRRWQAKRRANSPERLRRGLEKAGVR